MMKRAFIYLPVRILFFLRVRKSILQRCLWATTSTFIGQYFLAFHVLIIIGACQLHFAIKETIRREGGKTKMIVDY